MARNAAWPDWLADLSWREVWFTLEVAGPATLPPYLGSTLRGALGHLLGGASSGDAGRAYAELFERQNQRVKPFVLLAPPMPGLAELAAGAPVNEPYKQGSPRRGESVPSLCCEAGWKFDPGGTVRFGLRLVGAVSVTLPAIVEAIARNGLELSGAMFRLTEAQDCAGQLLYHQHLPGVGVQMPPLQRLCLEIETARRVRILFLTPTVFKLDRAPTFEPEHFARRFFEHSVGRAVQMYDACMGKPKLPFEPEPTIQARMAEHRLFHYELQRRSYRQGKWLDFDGVVGFLDLEGDLSSGMPWARAAEVLHFGQKATFGLGKVRVLVLE